MEAITAQQVIDEARKHLGTARAHQGRGGAGGLDCINLGITVGLALKNLTTTIYDEIPSNYRAVDLPKMMDVFWRYVDELPIDELQPGCGALFAHRRSDGKPAHLGILTDVGVIEVFSNDKVSEHVLDEGQRERIVAGFKYRGLVL